MQQLSAEKLHCSSSRKFRQNRFAPPSRTLKDCPHKHKVHAWEGCTSRRKGMRARCCCLLLALPDFRHFRFRAAVGLKADISVQVAPVPVYEYMTSLPYLISG